MMLGAVLLIVALATSDAAPNREYDLPDCRTQKMAYGTHHAENPDDCRTFYNCDNAYGGKLTCCPAGTIYDSDIGLCTGEGDCRDWYEKANCLSNPRGTGRFQGNCWNCYYEYSCASRSFVTVKCPENQYFVPNGQSDGSCGFTIPRPTRCMNGSSASESATCESSGLEYMGPCEFKHRGDFNIMKCAAGTKMDPSACQCVYDNDNTCPQPPPVTPVKTGCGSANVETFVEYDRAQAGCQPVDTLSGRDLGFKAFALKMSFTLSRPSTGGQISILTTPDGACQGLQLDVSVVSGNAVKVTVRKNGRQVVLEGNIGGFASVGTNIVLRIVFDINGKQFLGSVNSSPLTDVSGGNVGTLEVWPNENQLLCLPCLDNVSGRTEFSVWRGCTDLSQLI